MKPEAQPHPRQDSQQTKDAGGRPVPNGAMANLSLCTERRFHRLAPLTRVKVTPPTTSANAPAPFRGGVIGGYDIGVAWKLPNEAVRRAVNCPS
jgi:hypothetical protein